MLKKFLFFFFLGLSACSVSQSLTPVGSQPSTAEAGVPLTNSPVVPFTKRWGIYRLDLTSQAVELIFNSPTQLSSLRLNNAGDQFVFSQKVGGESDTREEIFALNSDGSNLQRLTDNQYWDLYPAWSPDDNQIAFISHRNDSLGIFIMEADGSSPRSVFDSAAHEADLDWVGNLVAFTKDSRIWVMQADGSTARPLTEPPRAGEWGAANLPFGDYDPRISPDASRVVFERLWDDTSPHGNYDIYVQDLASFQEVRLTASGYSQGLASWSHSGQQLVYIVAAIDQSGKYDLYLMNADGTDNRNITPDYFPPQFLCHWAIFSRDDTAIFFIGEWWQED